MMNETGEENKYFDDEIDLRGFLLILWSDKKIIASATTAFAVGTVIAALMMTDIYRAEAILAPTDSGNPGNLLGNQFSSVAALTGINLGMNDNSIVNYAIATLHSKKFLGEFIKEHNLLVPLFAETWDAESNESKLDADKYDAQTHTWMLTGGTPTDAESIRKLSEILQVTQELDTGLVHISIDWHNPVQAANWVNQLVEDINRDMKQRDVGEASDAVAFLQKQLTSTQLVDMQQVLYDLIESQTRIIMLADVRDEYVFRVIDSAVTPDRKLEPNRAMISVMGTLIGFILSIACVLVRREIYVSPPLEN